MAWADGNAPRCFLPRRPGVSPDHRRRGRM